MKVLVLNCFSRNALAAINALDSSYKIYGGAPQNKWSILDSFFRHEKLNKIFRYERLDNPDKYVQNIIKLISKYKIDIVIPTGTTETDILSTFKDVIESKTRAKLLVEKYSILKTLTDKDILMKRAKELGLTIPFTKYCETISDLKTLINDNTIKLPFIIKPIRSYASKGLYVFKNELELKQFLDSDHNNNYTEFIVQDYIDGEIYDACMLSNNGTVAYGLTQCRKMTWGNTGSGIINITTYNQEAIDTASMLLNDSKYSGISMFEFIRQTTDGKFFLIECNPKIWGTTDLTIKAGLNIVQDAIDLIILNKQVPNKEYKVGLLYKWIFPECISSMVLKKPKGIKTFISEYKKTINNYNASEIILNTRVNSLRSLILEVLNKA